MRGDGFVSTAGVAVAMLPATLAMRYVFPLDPWWLWGAYAFFMVGGLSAVTGIASYALAEVRWNWQNLQWRIFAVLTVAASLAVSGLIRLIGTPCVAGCPFSSVVP
jgi:hypothetical protein